MDICYLDPTFSLRRKSSAVEKLMRILHDLFWNIDSTDMNSLYWWRREEGRLMEVALSLAQHRVLVKHHVGASYLGVGAGDDGDVGVRMPLY